jgi:hypothetical protein
MANSAGDNIPKLELGGEITPEDAERFAAAFRPSWELDDAPFEMRSQLASEDLISLSGDVNTIVDLPRVEEPFRPAVSGAPEPPKPVAAAPVMQAPQQPPLTSTLAMKPSPAQKPAVAGAPAAPAGYDGVAPLYLKPSKTSQASSTRDDIEVPIRRSNKGLVFALVGVVALAAIGVGVKMAVSSEDDQPKASPASTIREESTRAIPPPAETTAAAATGATPTPPATTAIPAPPATTAAANAALPAHATAAAHTATPPAQPVRTAAAAQPAPRPAPPPAPAQPKTPPKPAGGGIVRDNPF